MDFSLEIRQDRLGVIRDAIDSHSNPGKIDFYTDPVPNPGTDITTQTKLATINFTKPCSTITSNVLEFIFENSGVVSCLATGDSTWCRFSNGNNVWCSDASVSNENGTGDVKIDNVSFIEGALISVITATLSEP